MIEIGVYQTLEVLRTTSVGVFLGDGSGQDVLLPLKYVPPQVRIGDSIRVFVYKDSEHRPVATTLEPRITLGQFGYLRVSWVNDAGAFMDWGLEKDLFVPFKEQPRRMELGQYHMVFLYLEEETERLAASGHVYRFLQEVPLTIAEGEAVDLLIWEETDLGYNVIINHLYKGLLYRNEVFARLQPGEHRQGYVKRIREDDKVDVTLQLPGPAQIEPHAQQILEMLRSCGGFLPLNDDSDPAEISRTLEMSKKSFKKAVGSLYKQHLIRLAAEGIYLVRLS
ncbi:MAG: S1-like domain-containing RNA-binding protein [Bacteroidia bacterium]|nr:S1-like domain-containing RNA-binding protein [Bacteroidia bacterium]